MIRLICFVKRKAGLGREAFHDHWLSQHGPLIRDTPELARHIVRYEQNHRLPEDYRREAGPPEADVGFDGVTLQWFETFDDFVAFVREDAYPRLIAPDEERFLDRSALALMFSDRETVMIPAPADPGVVGAKLLCLLKRIEGRSAESFHDHWKGIHGPLMRDTPELARHLLGYVQHHRMVSDYARDAGGGHDGLAEQWFASFDAFESFAGEPAYRARVVPDEDRLIDRPAIRWVMTGPAHVIIE